MTSALSDTQREALLVITGERVMREWWTDSQGVRHAHRWLPSRATVAALERRGLIRSTGSQKGGYSERWEVTESGRAALRDTGR